MNKIISLDRISLVHDSPVSNEFVQSSARENDLPLLKYERGFESRVYPITAPNSMIVPVITVSPAVPRSCHLYFRSVSMSYADKFQLFRRLSL